MSESLAQRAIDHGRQRFDTYFEDLLQLLRIPSVSTDPSYETDLRRCVDWILGEMGRIGLENCRSIPTEKHPVIYGDWLNAGPDRPTIIIFSHYDVQPVDPIELWESSPFEPQIREGKLYARGVSDTKCSVWASLKAIEAVLSVNGNLPVNVKIVYEGEEETGSPSMPAVLQAHKSLFKADALIILDGPFAPERPMIVYTRRGIIAAEVSIQGPGHDLHSGAYGGTVHNPLQLLGQIIGSFHDEAGRVQIPHFYDEAQQLGSEEFEAMQEVWQLDQARWEDGAGVDHFWAESIGTKAERLTALPTLEVNGVWGGYTGPGMKTVIPAKAGFKVTLRLVANQDPHEIAGRFKEHVLSFSCDTLDLHVAIMHEAWPLTMPREGSVVEAVQRAHESVLGKRALLVRGGGTQPCGGLFQRELDLQMTGMNLGSGGNAHAPNEFFNIPDLSTIVDLMIHFLYHFADVMTQSGE